MEAPWPARFSAPSRPIPEPPGGGPVAATPKTNFPGASQSPVRRGWRSQTETTNRKETMKWRATESLR